MKYVQCSPAIMLICRCSGIEFSAAKRIEMCSAVMKLLGFADTQESCFEAWNRSHMGFSTLLCGRFADSRKRVFRLRNIQIWVVLSWNVVILLIFRNSVFKVRNVQIWTVKNSKIVYLLIVRKGIFRLLNVLIRAVHSSKRVDFLILWNSIFSVRNVEILAVLSSN